MGKVQQALALLMVVIVGGLFIYVASSNMPAFGSFPQRQIGENAVGQLILENATNIMQLSKPPIGQAVVANIVTSVVWGYRGFDTLGEAIVLFTAVLGVIAMFRATRGRE